MEGLGEGGGGVEAGEGKEEGAGGGGEGGQVDADRELEGSERGNSCMRLGFDVDGFRVLNVAIMLGGGVGGGGGG